MFEYIRKPDKITAVQWDGTNADEIFEFTGGKFEPLPVYNVEKGFLPLRFLSNAAVGDYVVKDYRGVFVEKKENFEKIYELIPTPRMYHVPPTRAEAILRAKESLAEEETKSTEETKQ